MIFGTYNSDVGWTEINNKIINKDIINDQTRHILPEIKRLQEHITNLESRNAELELENRRLRELLGSHQNKHTSDTPVANTKVVQGTLEHSIGKSSANMSTSASNVPIPAAGLGTESSAWAMLPVVSNP
ncbi:hypothetical protein G6F51_013523 [Rhizopus arrhizus]|uniref:Uncharacterized protein n=1 Tax=Rhizopus oryzae TaxID=64495 RepID=A0A9P6XSS6_RHIOR|nr:hypothetical protein G6F51_013523 [Rhizopus arrhizus]